MKLELRKITNGFICSIDGKETFHDVPEAICGQMSEWVLKECERLAASKTYGDVAADSAGYAAQMQTILGQLQNAEAVAAQQEAGMKSGDTVRFRMPKMPWADFK